MPALLTLLTLFFASPPARADWDPQSYDVVLLKRPGILAYEEVTEAFQEHCRVPLRVVVLDENQWIAPGSLATLRRARLVVAVGQPAVNVARSGPAPIAYALATDPPAGAYGAESYAPPEQQFRALLAARPSVQRIGTISGRRGAARLQKARLAARALGLRLVERAAETGPQAILMLRDLVEGDSPVDALWIGADPQLVTTPVFQYLLRLQLQHDVPVLAATRQQVRSGALMAVDFRPSAVGRRLAALVNRILDSDRRPGPPPREEPMGVPEVSMNSLMARKLGIQLAAGKAAGWLLE